MLPLASKNGYSATIGISDVDLLIAAFEEINQVHFKVEMERRAFKGSSALFCSAAAFEMKEGSQVARCLASQSVRCLGTDLQTMDALVFQLLYALDGQLASKEFARVRKK